MTGGNEWVVITVLCAFLTGINTRSHSDRWRRETENPITPSVGVGGSQSCGVSAKILANIKTPGQSEIKDFPWMAGIIRKSDKFHFCGGVIITPRHILTASHCIHGVLCSKILVRIGEYDFTRQNDSIFRDYDVAAIIEHSYYDPGTYEHDIAILVVTIPIKYSIYAQPICLPSPGNNYVNKTCIVAGWGTLGYGAPKSDILMEVAVPVWPQEKCVKAYTQTIFKTNLCAGGYNGGLDSCQGDSGGPLMYQREDKKWITVGVVSWGIKCAMKGRPGVYSRVDEYLPWIGSIINNNRTYVCGGEAMHFPV